MSIHMFNIKTGTSTEWIQFTLPVFQQLLFLGT